MAPLPRRYVALMGDLVDSEGAPSRARLHRLFNEAIDRENERSEGIMSPLTITLGDEFQGLAASFSDALTIAQRIRIRLLTENIECRFAIGLVSLASPLNTTNAWNMLGAGLADTRDLLNEKSGASAYRFFLPSRRHRLLARLMDGIARALTSTERNWTDRQLTIVWGSVVEEESVKALSEAFGSTSRNIYKLREAARFESYLHWWADLHAAAQHLDTEHHLS